MAEKNSKDPLFSGLKKAASFKNTDYKIFGKPCSRPFRRMGVALSYGTESVDILVNKAKQVASCIKVS